MVVPPTSQPQTIASFRITTLSPPILNSPQPVSYISTIIPLPPPIFTDSTTNPPIHQPVLDASLLNDEIDLDDDIVVPITNKYYQIMNRKLNAQVHRAYLFSPTNF